MEGKSWQHFLAKEVPSCGKKEGINGVGGGGGGGGGGLGGCIFGEERAPAGTPGDLFLKLRFLSRRDSLRERLEQKEPRSPFGGKRTVKNFAWPRFLALLKTSRKKKKKKKRKI